ncbi:MAG TPA: YbhB/YbcL family Raf kinase inhibitor-like protein [Candidatus Sulfotelmatobacter sp.]|jgi:Raf kinase inhibitor-like YbhB/YbcL family protein
MQLNSQSFQNGSPIPAEFAFGRIDPIHLFALSQNRNPQLEWKDVPEPAKSFVLICHDVDVPSRPDDVNQEGREVPASLPRIEFFHWLLLDIPVATREIAAGSYSNGVTPRGKSGPEAPHGLRQGLNDFTGWFANDPNMKGTYFGYDGPAPPWNDSVVHHYTFTLYAIDVPKLEVKGDLTGANVREALSGHILAQAKISGTYTLTPRLERY